MPKFYVKVEKEMVVEAKDEDDALNEFFKKWEEDCGDGNTTEMIELNDSAEVHPATKEEIEDSE